MAIDLWYHIKINITKLIQSFNIIDIKLQNHIGSIENNIHNTKKLYRYFKQQNRLHR